jgi:hypothetical protein
MNTGFTCSKCGASDVNTMYYIGGKSMCSECYSKLTPSVSYYQVHNPLPEVRHCPMCGGSNLETISCGFCRGTGHLVTWPETDNYTITYTTSTEEDVTPSCGNVFEDIGQPNAEGLLKDSQQLLKEEDIQLKIQQLESALRMAVGFVSTHPFYSDMHPEEVYDSFMKHALDPEVAMVLGDSYYKKPEHCCGARGFGLGLDDTCLACEREAANRKAKAVCPDCGGTRKAPCPGDSPTDQCPTCLGRISETK